MSKIDAQIKLLLEKKKKIDYINYILDLLKNDKKCIDFLEIKDAVLEKLEPFLASLSTAIETDTDVPVSATSNQFSNSEVTALKTIVAKLTAKSNIEQPIKASSTNESFSKPEQPIVAKELSTSEKMNFALSNRHLAMKQVQVLNDKNVKITGQVCGLDAPFVLVKTETGPVIQVPLENIVLV